MRVIIAEQNANTQVATKSTTGTCYLGARTVAISGCHSMTI